MMKQTNMKQIGCLICVAVLLAGCQPPPPGATLKSQHANHTRFFHASERHALVVDGDSYSYFGRSGEMDGEFVYSFIVVFPVRDKRYIPVLRYTDEIKALIYQFEKEQAPLGLTSFTEQPLLGGIQIADVDFNYVYFVDDGQVIFRKSNEELGIDVSDPQRAFDTSRLNPILEQMIREHVQPLEPEMEEEQPL